MRILNNNLYKHGLVVAFFAFFAQLFYYPSISGKKLLQSDIVQYSGMSRQIKEYRSQNDGKEAYWIDNAFGGMPTYQLGAKYPADFLGIIHGVFKILPRPAYILFLYLFSSYILFLVLKLDWKIALFGSFAFGLSTYLLIILQVGHNTKAMALSYMPFAIAGLFLLLDKRWLSGFIISLLGIGLNIRANHYQMSYYLLIFLFILVIVYSIDAYRKNNLKSHLKSITLFALSGFLAIGLNATPILATSEYSKFSTRNGSELKLNFDGSKKTESNGLDYNYITEYSYGIFESLSLIIPRIQGGGSRENLGSDSELYEFLVKRGVPIKQSKDFVSYVPTYWGSQPILEAPAYIGIVVFIFALFAIISLKGPLRNSLLIASILSLILSWGKNFSILTDFFIYNVPFYNKFRAVSSIQVILELCIPILAVLGLQRLLSDPNKYFKTFIKVIIGLIVFLSSFFLFKGLGMISFNSPIDSRLIEAYGQDLMDQILMARAVIFNDDILRGIILLLSILFVFALYKAKKIKKNIAITLFIGILIYDLGGIANRYLDWDRFVNKSKAEAPFSITNGDKTILNDVSRYRVYEPVLGLTGARTSYFHNSIGGYHGAKPRRFQELYEFFNYNEIPEILNMLNVKYVLYESEKGLSPLINNDAQGNAWIIDSLVKVNSADQVLESFKSINLKTDAVVEDDNIAKALKIDNNIDYDASIELIEDSVNLLKYSFNSKSRQVVVFSEMFYENGWKASIDGQEVPHYRVNYILRALPVNKGKHIISFEFIPEVIELGTKIRYTSMSLFALIIILIVFNSNFKFK
mgnify:FL=1